MKLLQFCKYRQIVKPHNFLCNVIALYVSFLYLYLYLSLTYLRIRVYFQPMVSQQTGGHTF